MPPEQNQNRGHHRRHPSPRRPPRRRVRHRQKNGRGHRGHARNRGRGPGARARSRGDEHRRHGRSPKGVKIHMVPALHSAEKGNAAGVVVEMDGKNIYHAGDTGLTYDMKIIGEYFHPDLSFIPIGDRYTMGPASAAKAVEFVQTKKVVPIHYGTFPLVAGDPEEFKKNVGPLAEVIILKPGGNLIRFCALLWAKNRWPISSTGTISWALFPGHLKDPENKMKLVRRLIAFQRLRRTRVILVFDGRRFRRWRKMTRPRADSTSFILRPAKPRTRHDGDLPGQPDVRRIFRRELGPRNRDLRPAQRRPASRLAGVHRRAQTDPQGTQAGEGNGQKMRPSLTSLEVRFWMPGFQGEKMTGVSIIGAGRLGTSLGLASQKKDSRFSGLRTEDPAAARESRRIIGRGPGHDGCRPSRRARGPRFYRVPDEEIARSPKHSPGARSSGRKKSFSIRAEFFLPKRSGRLKPRARCAPRSIPSNLFPGKTCRRAISKRSLSASRGTQSAGSPEESSEKSAPSPFLVKPRTSVSTMPRAAWPPIFSSRCLTWPVSCSSRSASGKGGHENSAPARRRNFTERKTS